VGLDVGGECAAPSARGRSSWRDLEARDELGLELELADGVGVSRGDGCAPEVFVDFVAYDRVV